MILDYLEPNTKITFELQGTLPIFKEIYISSAGKTVLRGLFVPKAYLETTDGTNYRMLGARRDRERLNEIAYPLVRLPDKVEILRLRTPGITFEARNQARPPLRFTCRIERDAYILKRTHRLGRAFEIWDGMEMHRVVQRDPKPGLVLDALVMEPIPALLVLLLPWLDSLPLD